MKIPWILLDQRRNRQRRCERPGRSLSHPAGKVLRMKTAHFVRAILAPRHATLVVLTDGLQPEFRSSFLLLRRCCPGPLNSNTLQTGQQSSRLAYFICYLEQRGRRFVVAFSRRHGSSGPQSINVPSGLVESRLVQFGHRRNRALHDLLGSLDVTGRCTICCCEGAE